MKQFASFRLDTANECLWREGTQIALPPRIFGVLRYLVDHAGRLITHDELLDALWPETYVQPQVLRTYVLELRKVLGDDAAQPRFIQTIPKRGYCFVAPVSDGDADGCPPSESVTTLPVAGNGAGSVNNSLGIVGRDEDLARLREMAAITANGQRRMVFVTGEAGIGKTALVDAFCHGLRGTGIVARGQCVEGFGEKEAYYPVMEALAHLCAAEEEKACRVLARAAPAWLAAVGRQGDNGGSATARERTPGDLCSALEQIAEKRLLVLVFEDVHWADDATLNLIAAMARRRARARLMVVLTCAQGYGRGSGEHHLLEGMKQNLLIRQLCSEIALAPLTRTAMSRLLTQELRQEMLPAGLTGFVHQRSEGNPLFAIAILEHLIARRFLVRAETAGAARWQPAGAFHEMEGEVPERLAQMIELEIEGLSQEEQRILGVGSAMGIAFPAWAVAAALDADAAHIEEACDALARRLHFVERGGEDELPGGMRSQFYVFVHGLYREVLYRRQSAARRAAWHARIAERLGEIFAGREASVTREIAMHYEAAGDWQRALDALRSAAVHGNGGSAELMKDALRLAEKLGC